MTMSSVPLFVWSIFITAWLLLQSLPVQAGAYCAPLGELSRLSSWNPELTSSGILTVCWEKLYFSVLAQSAETIDGLTVAQRPMFLLKGRGFISGVNPFSLETSNKGILRDFTSEQIIDSWFPSYITGLYEGDGYIYIPKYPRTSKGQLQYPCFQLTLPQKDFPQLSVLSTCFDKCSIQRKSDAKAYVQNVNSLSDMIKVYKQLNGNVKTNNKYQQLKNLYMYLSSKPEISLQRSTPPQLPINNVLIGSDYWLSGFIEAEGCFYIRTTKTQKRIRVTFEFSLVQNEINKSVMDSIANFLEVPQSVVKSENQYRVRTTSFKSVELLCTYMRSYQIFGSKWMDYQDWENGYKYHKKIDDVQQSYLFNVNLKTGMNTNRRSFQWNHLSCQVQAINPFRGLLWRGGALPQR